MYTVRFLILTEGQSGWTVEQYSTRYRALKRSCSNGLPNLQGLCASPGTLPKKFRSTNT